MNISWLHRVVSGTQQGFFATITRFCLGCLEPLYRWGIHRRNRQYDDGRREIQRVAATVISIGNITTGGTGKTPAVIWVCQFLQSHGIEPAIVSRGYGAEDSDLPNDESMELSDRLPDTHHVQNPDRVAAANQCIAEHSSQVIVLDDGFQHRRIARDLDIVLIDANNPFGYGHLLPRGLLREPIESLVRADAIIITRCERAADQIESLKQQIVEHTKAPIALARTEPVGLVEKDGQIHDVTNLQTGKWFVFSAIGNPTAFETSLNALGCHVCGSMRFRDHHLFEPSDHQQIAEAAHEAGAEFLICTHKDLVKLDPEQFEFSLFALQTQLQIFEGENNLCEKILATRNHKP